ncbi:response regulator transcription factor [Histidinibacterium aquaticum]|uniref:Response regulator transcription factor n=1 Tax=Histidinibacterium aquaticum TaxID=2613962 RepID=A0A5J5GRI8_9RHOB|nr:winged helix-turn-helix domain-containing protein [Histidinibacterium aquaticum]KAA9009982.1 response regulator transcription factor [Histidinibacterium aquaticum]
MFKDGESRRAEVTALVVEDQETQPVRTWLAQTEGLELLRTRSFERARRLAGSVRQLDFMVVPSDDQTIGLIFFTKLRHPDCRVVVVDSMTDEESVVEALEAGADDVVRADVSRREFSARLRLPREGIDAAEAGTILARLQLTPIEYAIAARLMQTPGRVVTRDALSQVTDSTTWTYGDRKFDVHVAKIRRKLEQEFGDRYVIRTIRSIGYVLSDGPVQG